MSDDVFQRSMMQAAHFMRAQQFDRAAERLRAALAADPESGPAYYGLAFCLWQTEKYREADGAADEALRLQPDSANSYYIKGCVQASLEKYVEARRYLQRAVELDPEDSATYLALGHVLLELKLYPHARAAAVKALEYDPQTAAPRILMGKVEEVLGNKGAAKRHLADAQRLEPEWSEAHHQMAVHSLRSGSGSDQSLDQMREALRLDPTNKTLQHNFIVAQTASNIFFRPLWRLSQLLENAPPGAGRLVIWIPLIVIAIIHTVLKPYPEMEWVTQGLVYVFFGALFYLGLAFILLRLYLVRTNLPHGEVNIQNVRDYLSNASPGVRLGAGCVGCIGIYVIFSMILGLIALLTSR